MNKLLPLIIVILFSNCFNRSLSDELLEIPLSSQVSSTISESMSTSKKIYFENSLCENPTIYKIVYSKKSLNNRKFFVNFNKSPVSNKIENSKIIHFGPLIYKDISIETYHSIKKINCIKLLDIQGLVRDEKKNEIIKYNNKQILKLISNFNIIKADEIEFKTLSKIAKLNRSKLIKKLFSIGIKEILVTNANQGSMVYNYKNKNGIYIPAFTLKKEIDTTGCGDIFAATYTLFRYKNFSTTKSSIAASKIAGLRSGMNKILYKKLKTNILKLLNEKKN